MSRIKTAWELALERTADIAIDKEAIQREKAVRQGKALAGQYLNNPEEVSLKKELEKLDKKDASLVREGLRETLLANLSLPRMETDLPRLQIVSDGLKMLGGRGLGNLEQMLKQCRDLFNQYLNTIKQMEDDLRARWEPVLRQKEQSLRKQTGQAFQLSPEQDPEYVKALADQLAALEARFAEVLNKGKEEIRKLV